MTVQEIAQQLDFTFVTGEEHQNREVAGAYVSDLLSDVMGNAEEGQVWLTLQTHKNVIAIASLKEMAAVILVKGLMPDEEVIKAAKEEEVIILSSSLQTFEIAGKLYKALNS